MNWILNDLFHALEQLKRWQTWLVIGLIALFALLAYLVAGYAFRTDAILRFVNRTTGSCRELTNASIIFLFCGMMFFLFSSVITLGEFQRHFAFKQQNAHRQAAQSLRQGIFWVLVTVGIAVASLVFFTNYCR